VASSLKKISSSEQSQLSNSKAIGSPRSLGQAEFEMPAGYEDVSNSRVSKSFTEWLLSPSLYPSDERILSYRLTARRSSDFKGSFYSLETSRATYTFFCPSAASLKSNWPRLKSLWIDFSSRYPGRVLGVRFLRTVGELPIWLDDEGIQLSINTPIKAGAEIACIIERRIISRTACSEFSERGIYGDEIRALAYLIDCQEPAKISFSPKHRRGVLTSSSKAELLPYELALKEVASGVSIEMDGFSIDDLELLTYESGLTAWGLRAKASREEILCCLREYFGPAVAETVVSLSRKRVSQLALALISSKTLVPKAFATDHELRRGIKDLVLGQNARDILLLVFDKDRALSAELGKVFETSVVFESRDIDIVLDSGFKDSVTVINMPSADSCIGVDLAVKAKQAGLKIITVQEAGSGGAGLIEVMPGRSLADQAISVLRGMSRLMMN
jgi:hypothetical protein